MKKNMSIVAVVSVALTVAMTIIFSYSHIWEKYINSAHQLSPSKTDTVILASTTSEEEIESPDGEYSMEIDMNEGLVLDLNSGDDVIVDSDGTTAQWIDENGDVIAVITMEVSDGSEIEFDPETGALAPESMEDTSDAALCAYTGVKQSGCGQLTKVVWTWAWTGLVCAPATVGVGGITKHPVATYAAGKGCYKTGQWIYKRAC